MPDLVLLQLPRTAQASLVAAFASVGVEVEIPKLQAAARTAERSKTPVATVLRNPIDRLQSFFNTRVRAGRPHHPEMWDDWEANVFTVFRSFNEWGEAITSQNEFLRSASDRAFVLWMRAYGLLGDVWKEVPRSQLTVAGTIDDLPAAVERLAGLVGCDVPLLPTDPEVVDATPDSLREPRSDLANLGFRTKMADEIDFYDRLLDRSR